MTDVVTLGQANGEAPTADEFRQALIESLQPVLGEKTPEAVNNLEAVVSNAASKAATKVVQPVLIGSVVGSAVTLIGVWLINRAGRR